MRRFKYLFVLLFTLFVPKVYAFTYDLNVDTVSNPDDNSLYDITVSLKDINGTIDGINLCNISISFYGGVKLDTAIKSLNNWNINTGKYYMFDISKGVTDNSDVFIIPVRLENDGSVELTDIECSDGKTTETIKNKSVNLTYDNTSGSIDITDDDIYSENELSNSNIIDIILSEGEIDFKSDVTEYYINVDEVDNLVIKPKLVDPNLEYTIDKYDDKVIIDVENLDGTKSVYTIFINSNLKDENVNINNDNRYVPIFIGIIFVLVLINIFRIVNNKKK